MNNNSPKKILITGGFGALGYNLTRHLLEKGDCEIHILDNLSAGTANFTTGVAFSHIDIGNSEKVRGFFQNYQPNVIYHLAAHFANQNSVDHPVSDATTNIIGIINIFEAQRNNPHLEKIVYSSSSCVYGNHVEMHEEQNITPYDTPYAINKYVGELYAKYYAEIHNVPAVCARIFNSYGPGEMPGAYRNVIPNFIRKALNNEDITITGTGDETRDFTYVTDTVGLLIKLQESGYRKGEVFNGGTGTKTPIRKVAEAIIKETGSQSKILYTSPRNWDHVVDRCSNISKSKEHLHYAPRVSFQEGLVETVKWIREKLQTTQP